MRNQTPKHLKTATRNWFCEIMRSYELEGHHVKLLTLAAQAWDQSQAAREVLRIEGMTYTDRFGAPRPRPEVAIERDCRVAFARLVRELGLDIAEPETTRPQTIQPHFKKG